jgi:hypothetical protein
LKQREGHAAVGATYTSDASEPSSALAKGLARSASVLPSPATCDERGRG